MIQQTFIELVKEGKEILELSSFLYNSESYFEKLFEWKKEKKNYLIKLYHLLKPGRHKKIYGKPLRKCMR